MKFTLLNYTTEKEKILSILKESFKYADHSFNKKFPKEDGDFWVNHCLPAYKFLFLQNEKNEYIGLVAYYLLQDIEIYKPFNDLYLYVSILEVKKEFRGNEYALQMLDEIKKQNHGKIIHLNADSDSVLHGYYLGRARFKLLDKKERLLEFY